MTTTASRARTRQFRGTSHRAARGPLPAHASPPATARLPIVIAEMIEDDPALFDDLEQSISVGLTKLQTFITSHKIKPAHLARASGYSRQHLLRIRIGRMDPTRRCMVAVTLACRVLSREKVLPFDLFEFSLDPRRNAVR